MADRWDPQAVTLADLAGIPATIAALQKDSEESLNELAESVHGEFKKVETRIDTLEDNMIKEFREVRNKIGSLKSDVSGLKVDIAEIKDILNGKHP